MGQIHAGTTSRLDGAERGLLHVGWPTGGEEAVVLAAAFGLHGFGIIGRVQDYRPREIGQR